MSDPFRDDREAQLARADALSIENERLKAERDALKEKLATQGASRVETTTAPSASTKPQITFYVGVNPTLRSEHGRLHARRVVTLDGQVVKIGRVASAHLRIDDPSVARMHAVIEANTAAEAFIFDLGSPSGTFVNGKRISKVAIQSGDVIKIGEIEMEILIVETR